MSHLLLNKTTDVDNHGHFSVLLQGRAWRTLPHIFLLQTIMSLFVFFAAAVFSTSGLLCLLPHSLCHKALHFALPGLARGVNQFGGDRRPSFPRLGSEIKTLVLRKSSPFEVLADWWMPVHSIWFSIHLFIYSNGLEEKHWIDKIRNRA